MKVLIADDSPLICETITSILKTFLRIEDVVAVGDGQHALNLVTSEPWDLVILDINIPQPNGLKVLERLKQHNPATKVIVFTNYPLPSYREECSRLGAEYFLDKTTESQSLLKVIKSVMPDQWPAIHVQ